MTTTTALIVLMLLLLTLLLGGALFYLVHTHPRLAAPLTVAMAGMALLAPSVVGIIAR
ncbi:hypothetical protein [Streptomyces sp. WM6386]|uniref:hypothetical protein n=1 Tax=Streptomyces sp. WM6386 TaxID=1415558 RepID=UPI000A63C965|nr:hypothetical protein [Streptomyces sp. WM6386]